MPANLKCYEHLVKAPSLMRVSHLLSCFLWVEAAQLRRVKVGTVPQVSGN